MTNAGSPGRTSTTANTTIVASTSVPNAGASRRERKSSMSVVARGGGRSPSLPIDPGQVELGGRRILPQANQVLFPDADLGELEEEAVHGVAGDDALRILQELV